jgi:hypothetical protein
MADLYASDNAHLWPDAAVSDLPRRYDSAIDLHNFAVPVYSSPLRDSFRLGRDIPDRTRAI